MTDHVPPLTPEGMPALLDLAIAELAELVPIAALAAGVGMVQFGYDLTPAVIPVQLPNGRPPELQGRYLIMLWVKNPIMGGPALCGYHDVPDPFALLNNRPAVTAVLTGLFRQLVTLRDKLLRGGN